MGETSDQNDLNARDDDGNTKLMRAVLQEDIEIVKSLLQKGADVNMRNNSLETAIMMTAKHRTSEIFSELLANRAALSIRNKDGDTVLNKAIVAKNEDLVTLLLNSDFDVFMPNLRGKNKLISPFVLANKGGNESIKNVVNEKYGEQLEQDNAMLKLNNIVL